MCMIQFSYLKMLYARPVQKAAQIVLKRMLTMFLAPLFALTVMQNIIKILLLKLVSLILLKISQLVNKINIFNI